MLKVLLKKEELTIRSLKIRRFRRGAQGNKKEVGREGKGRGRGRTGIF